jgi:hypothetical protein
MSSATAAPGALEAQLPRIASVPEFGRSAGDEAIELAEMAGLFLDPWQQFVLSNSLGMRPDGSWAAFEVGLVVSRQNGKGSILEARELAGLFLLGERLVIHSAHQFDTSLEAFRRLLFLIEDTPDLDRQVKRVSRAHGEEGVELLSGQRIRFRTRTKGGGRGFTGDCLILDEAMILPESAHGALLPTLSARPNPQVWYTGSAVDRQIHEHGIVLSRVRERGRAGDDESLAYFEFSVDGNLEELDLDVVRDPAAWREANPSLGIRISTEHVGREMASMDVRTFAVERLGIGDWPDLDVADQGGITSEMLAQCLERADPPPSIEDPVCFAFDTRPDRSYSSISSAGGRADGLKQFELVDRRPGTGWVAARLAELVGRHDPVAVICDEKSPAAALIGQISNLGVTVKTVNASEYARACGQMFDALDQGAVRHLNSPEIVTAAKGAARRPLGDAWAWSRRYSSVDISPLVAATLALWGFSEAEEDAAFTFEIFS